MMKWFSKWLVNRIKKAQNDVQENEQLYYEEEKRRQYASKSPTIGNAISSSGEMGGAGVKTLEFTMHIAEGGAVLRQTYYDQRTDRHFSRLHLIPDTEDVAMKVGHIVAMELLSAT